MKSKLWIVTSTLLVVGFAEASPIMTCSDLFRPLIANRYFEVEVERAEGVRGDLLRSESATLLLLRRGGANWQPAAASLVDAVQAVLDAIPANSYSVAPLIKAEKKLKPILQSSAEFKDLSTDELDFALALISGRDSSVSRKTRSTLHLLTEVHFHLTDSQSPELSSILRKLGHLSEKLQENNLTITRLSAAGNNRLFSKVNNVADVLGMRAKLESEIAAAKQVPPTVVHNLVMLAIEMQNARSGTFETTAESGAVEAKARAFFETEPFFAAARANQRYYDIWQDFIDRPWMSATHPDSATQLLRQFILETPQSAKKVRTLHTINEVLGYLRAG